MNDKKKSTSAEGSKSASVDKKPPLFYVATIIKRNKLSSVEAAAVMTAYRLKPTDQLEPAKFLKMVKELRGRKIKKTGRR